MEAGGLAEDAHQDNYDCTKDREHKTADRRQVFNNVIEPLHHYARSFFKAWPNADQPPR
jgi:hypothetical protein